MRPVLRYVLLVVLIGLQAITLAGVLTSNQLRTQGVLREHAHSVLGHLADTAADNTKRFLAPAERAAVLTQQMLDGKLISTQTPVDPLQLSKLEVYFIDQLQANPELDSIYFGASNGDFFFGHRQEQNFLIRRIQTQPKRTVVEWLMDPSHTPISRNLNPGNAFDPRTRPWYQTAQRERRKIWTEPYVFFSTQQPGITVAIPLLGTSGQVLGVVGVDIEISGLSAFLDNIPISPNGSAFIITGSRKVVAYPQSEHQESSELQTIDRMAKPAVAALLAQYQPDQFSRLSSRSFSDYSLEGEAQYGLLSPFAISETATWVIGVQAPAKDFVGRISALDQQYLWQIVWIGLVSCLLAIPLAFGFTRPMLLLYNQATTDDLTGLPNRMEFLRRAEETLQQASRKQQQVAVVMLDLDGFKEVNDQYGHPIGDEVLAAVAKRLGHAVRDGDVVGRLGGDEFAFVLGNVQSGEVEYLVDRIRQSIGEKPLKTSSGLHTIGGSAGVVLAERGNINQHLNKADQALLMAKALGKNRTLVVLNQPTL